MERLLNNFRKPMSNANSKAADDADDDIDGSLALPPRTAYCLVDCTSMLKPRPLGRWMIRLSSRRDAEE
eukprot:scaffold2003_cov139-Cylindrotheca_fusiformis.AAC.21